MCRFKVGVAELSQHFSTVLQKWLYLSLARFADSGDWPTLYYPLSRLDLVCISYCSLQDACPVAVAMGGVLLSG